MEFSRLLRRYGLAVFCVALAIVLVHLAFPPRGLHLTGAELLVEASKDYPAPPAVLDAASLAGDWVPVALPNANVPALETLVADNSDARPTQTSWYRVALPEPVLLDETNYLFIPRWKSDGELAIYANGRLQYQSHTNLLWNGSDQPVRIAFDRTAEAEPISEIVVRLQHLRGAGGALSSLWIGDFAEVGVPYLVRSFFQAHLPYISSAAYLVCGVLALIIWLGRRDERLYLIFFVMSWSAPHFDRTGGIADKA